MGSVDGVKKWVEWHLKILIDWTCPFQGYLLLLYIIPITSISEYLTFSAISMHFNNPTVNSQALPEELLDDPPGYRLKKLIKNCARKKQLQVHFNDWILVQLEILGQMLFVFFAFHPTIACKNCLAVGLTWLMRTLASGASVIKVWGTAWNHGYFLWSHLRTSFLRCQRTASKSWSWQPNWLVHCRYAESLVSIRWNNGTKTKTS